MKHSWIGRLVVLGVLMACGSEKTTEPIPQSTPPAALRLVLPDTITRGQSFSLAVTALDAQGNTNTGWSGTVALTATGGTLSPASVSVSGGTGSAQIQLTQHTGDVTIRSSVGTVVASQDAFVLSGMPVARILVHPATVMLSGAGTSQPLTAIALDADGLPTAVSGLTWQSSRPGVVAVSATGIASGSSVGSSQVTAQSGAVTSDPVLAFVTTPAAGVVLIPDDRFTGSITPVNPQARYGPGWQYRVRMTSPPPEIGQVIASGGEKPIVGRVMSVQSGASNVFDITLQLVTLDEVFPNLSIDESMPLRFEPATPSYFATRTRAPWAAITDTVSLGPVTCVLNLGLADNNPFALSSITRDATPTFQWHFVHNANRKRFVVQGGLTASLKATPTVTAAINGSADCRAKVGEIPIPLGGALSVFFGARVPVGLGFGFDGSITLATLGFDIEVSAGTTMSMGYDCNPGCDASSGVFSLTGSASGKVTPNLPQITSDFRVTAGISVFAWADLEFGPASFIPGADDLQITLLESKAGVKQEFNWAPAEVQQADPGYASNYSLSLFFSGGVPGDLQQAIDSLLGMAGIGLPPLKYESSTPLAESPAGSLQIIPTRVRGASASEPGDTATFVVDLSRTNYLTQYAVASVELFRAPASGSLVPAPGSCASMSASTGQSLFTCKTTFPISMAGDHSFYAFVKPVLGVALPVLLEVAEDSKSTLTVDSATYFWDFTTGAAGSAWNPGPVTTSPSGQRFLGEFGFNSTTLTLNNLPAHTQLELEFDIYIIDSWNGNGNSGDPDIIEVALVGGPALKRTTFSNKPEDPQAYPGNHPGGVNPAGTGAIAKNTLGYPPGSDYFGDSSYRLRLTFPHSGGTVAVRFASHQTSGSNERWGIDNVRVRFVP